MYIFAYFCLLAALLCSLGAGGLALIQLWQGRFEHLRLVTAAQWIMGFFLLLASALLIHALFWEDYRLEYVFSYTDATLPLFYRLTAFWAGQPGSMLFWALMTALAGTFFSFSRAAKNLDPAAAMWFWTFYSAIMAFFCLILTCWSNPFIMLQPVPPDGNGLNPLLQNPGMIFHPPLLFMGYAFFTVPACLALAQLLEAPLPWHRIARPYIVLSWTLLTAGIVLGAWWAYMELGWGGYWGWDPVENSSLVPWLVATACIHLLVVEKATGKLDRSASLLMALTVVSAFFATYLTRSGVIQSVHAFGDGGVGTPLLIFVFAAFVISCLIALASPKRGAGMDSPLSREGCLTLACWLFLALALIILIATLWPVFSSFSQAAPQGLDASFYNRVCLPLAAILLALLCVCTWLGWTGGFRDNRARLLFLAVCGSFAASAGAIWLAGYHKPLPLIGASAAIAIICASMMHILDRSVWSNARAFSALGVHFGIGLLALGVSFSGPYTTEQELLLSRGQSGQAGPYRVELEQVRDGAGNGYDFLEAGLKISLDGKTVGSLAPQRRIYAKFGTMQFSEVDVISTIGQDIYASLLGMDEDYKVLVKISIEPMVSWIWIGGAIMCLLPILALLFIRPGKAPAR